MYNNPMYKEAAKNMSSEQMKSMMNMMSGMSDDQLKSYAKMAGMGDVDPSFMRSQMSNMSNMDDTQINQMKNMAEHNYNYMQAGQQAKQQQSTQQSAYPEIQSLKEKGNDFFKKKQFDQASAYYLKAINQIEEERLQKGKEPGLDELEVSCRLNYANVKSKTGEYEVSLKQAQEALKIKENGKAYFRIGQALHHMGKDKLALTNLEKAKNMLKDDSVVELYNTVKEIVAPNEPELNKQSSTNSNTAQEDQPSSSSNKGGRMKKRGNVDNDDPDLAKFKKVPQNKSSDNDNYYHASNTTTDDVKIEDEPEEQKTSTTNAQPNPGLGNFGGGNMDTDKIRQGQEQLKNMSPEQLKFMTDQFKNNDNTFLRQAMKAQGMDMSDEQLNQMKKMMTPEMLQNVANMDPNSMPRPGSGFGGFPQASSSGNSGSTNAAPTMPDMSQGMPNVSPDMIKQMTEMLKSNPEMLKNMAGMLGENHPLSKFLQNKSPEELQKYAGYISKFAGVMGYLSPVYNFFKSYKQLIFGLIIGYIVYRFIN